MLWDADGLGGRDLAVLESSGKGSHLRFGHGKPTGQPRSEFENFFQNSFLSIINLVLLMQCLAAY